MKTKEGSFWRRARGTGKTKAVLNKGFEKQRDLVKELSPLAARFVAELRPVLRGLDNGRINNRVKSCLHQSLKAKGGIDYRHFNDFVFQPDYPLHNVLYQDPKFKEEGEHVVMRMEIPDGGAVKRQNGIVGHYMLALVMMVGDPFAEAELNSFVVNSDLFAMEQAYEQGCELRMKRPDGGEPWICFLRVVAYEDLKVAHHSRHSGMKVIGWNGMGHSSRQKRTAEG